MSVGIGLDCTYNSISGKDADDRRSKSGKVKESDERLGDEGGKDASEIIAATHYVTLLLLNNENRRRNKYF